MDLTEFFLFLEQPSQVVIEFDFQILRDWAGNFILLIVEFAKPGFFHEQLVAAATVHHGSLILIKKFY